MYDILKASRRVRRATAGLTARKVRSLTALTLMIGAVSGAFLFAAPAATPDAVGGVMADATKLNENDRLLASAIFTAQDRGDIDWADDLMAQMQNQLLLGHMLAQRYLQPEYIATKDELLVWLANYADHPQAAAIRTLALRKGATDENATPATDTAMLKGRGYIDHLGRSAMPNAWYTALRLYKEGSFTTARGTFETIGNSEKLSEWQRAAGYYWAARADDKLNRADDAERFREKAAQFGTTFYGQLASYQLRGTTPLMAAAPTVPSDLRNNPHTLRAAALASINQRDLAEDELRQLAMTLEKDHRRVVLTLAGEMGLANLQVRLSNLKGLSPEENLYGNYPMPAWVVGAQSVIDPTLLLSMARQESAFRGEVKSSAGAQGMMQMLPSTARHVETTLSADTIALASTNDAIPLSKQLDDPAVSVRLGAEYVSMLERDPAVKGNLVKLIAAYNAGSGSVASWQAASRNVTDPLLYIESIPYPETRNYVMQVLAHQWVYQTLLGEEPKGLEAIANGEWPLLRS